jgi:hypothetical protein
MIGNRVALSLLPAASGIGWLGDTSYTATENFSHAKSSTSSMKFAPHTGASIALLEKFFRAFRGRKNYFVLYVAFSPVGRAVLLNRVGADTISPISP